MNKLVKINDIEYFKFDYVFINKGLPIFLNVKNVHCRNKKDIALFINSCDNINKLSDFLNKFNLDVEIVKRYTHYQVGFIDTYSSVNKRKVVDRPLSGDEIYTKFLNGEYEDLN